MGDVMNQLRLLRPPVVDARLSASVLSDASNALMSQKHFQQRPRERLFAVLVAAVSLAHAVWTVVFMNGLAR